MRRFVAVAASAALWVPGASAAPAGFYEAKSFEPAASYVAHKPVKVYCANTMRAWRASLGTYAGADIDGLSVPGARSTQLNPQVCDVLDLYGDGSPTPAFAIDGFAEAIETVTHEAVHLRGVSDEGVADCAAMHAMAYVAVRFFHVSRGQPLKTLMESAWAFHRGQSAAYRTRC